MPRFPPACARRPPIRARTDAFGLLVALPALLAAAMPCSPPPPRAQAPAPLLADNGGGYETPGSCVSQATSTWYINSCEQVCAHRWRGRCMESRARARGDCCVRPWRRAAPCWFRLSADRPAWRPPSLCAAQSVLLQRLILPYDESVAVSAEWVTVRPAARIARVPPCPLPPRALSARRRCRARRTRVARRRLPTLARCPRWVGSKGTAAPAG